MITCTHCHQLPAMTATGFCLTCDIEVDRQVAVMEQHLAKRATVHHYEYLAAEAAAEVPARLGRTDEAGPLRRPNDPAFVSAGGRTAP